MASGRLGVADLAATTDTTVYTCPTDTFAVVTISICNRSASSVTARIALATTGTPADSEYLEFDSTILPKGVLERTGMVLAAGQRVVVRSSTTSVNAIVTGIETSTV